MSYEYMEPIEAFNFPHVVEDINGNVLALTYNIVQARFIARKYDSFMAVSTHVRPANEDDVNSFRLRLGDV